LLADLIRHGLTARVGAVSVTEIADDQQTAARLREIGPEIVIVGPAAQPADAALIRTILPDARLLAVSQDLSRLIDLDTGESDTFTADALADRLRR
jgi:hypothetical protein